MSRLPAEFLFVPPEQVFGVAERVAPFPMTSGCGAKATM